MENLIYARANRGAGQPGPKVTLGLIERLIAREQYHQFKGTHHTVCCLTLENGFSVVGEAAYANSKDLDAQTGRDLAREDAVSKVWLLEGYLLRQQLHYQENTDGN